MPLNKETKPKPVFVGWRSMFYPSVGIDTFFYITLSINAGAKNLNGVLDIKKWQL